MSEKQSAELLELDHILAQLTSTTIGRRLFLASVPALLTACATQERHRTREGDNSGQKTEMTVADEKKMTQEALKEMRKDYPPVQDPELQRYVTQVGSHVARSSQLEGRPYNYTFTVVDVPYVNAFALPAGTIMVTAPLLAMAENEAEFAGVIGHEIGHVKARHTAERIDKAKKEEGKTWLYGVGGGLLGGLLGYGVGRMACKEQDKKCLQQAAKLGLAAGAAGGLLIQKYKFMANSREDEMEADRIGFRTAVAAGYHKEHVGTFYEKLLQMEQAAKKKGNPVLASLADAMSTHPPSKERVKQMHEMASQQRLSSNAIVSSKAFEVARSRSKAIAAKKAKG